MFLGDLTVEWGDCDEAGIVFYPNFFYWFDCSFQRLLRSRGLSQRELKKRFGAVTPIVDVGAQFRSPARYDDVLRIETTIETWEARRFKVAYEVHCGETLVATGFELRAWALVDANGGIRGAPVHADFKNLMSGPLS
jgi:4-hydroxybenzoyl-CoA thioesterase